MSSWKDRVYQFEQNPPGQAWDKIVAALDEAHLDQSFPSTLYNSEVEPPAEAWGEIASALDQEANSSSVRPTVRRLRVFRYTAAAVVVGIVSFAVIKFTGANREKAGAEPVARTSPDTVNHDAAEPAKAAGNLAKSPTVNSDKEEGSLVTASNEGIVRSAGRRTVSKRSDDLNGVMATTDYTANEIQPNLADRYILLVTPTGLIRISKKWGSLVCCVSGQDQDEDCTDQIKKWQEKLACSNSTSTGSFLDLLSLVSSLNSEL
jgi:hypothetical protein